MIWLENTESYNWSMLRKKMCSSEYSI